MAAPLRILRVISRLCIGGPAHQILLLGEHLDRDRFRQLIVTGAPRDGEVSLVPEARRRGLDVVELPRMRRPLDPRHDLPAFASLLGVARRFAPDLVHTHTAKAGALGRPVARLLGVPAVHTFHGHVFDGYFGPRTSGAFAAIERGLARLTARVVAISEAQRRDLVERFRIASAERVALVELGIPLDELARPVAPAERQRLRAELGVADDTPLLGCVGRVAAVKDHDTLLRSFARLAGGAPGAPPRPQPRLLIVGDGPEVGRLRALAVALGVAERVDWLGYRRDLARIYPALDLVVSSSRMEGTPVVLIESQTAGVPFVATDVGGVRDIAHPGAGLLCAAGDVDGLARAMGAALARLEPLRRGAAAARAATLERFGHRRLLRDLAALYDEVVAERALGGAARVRPPRPDDRRADAPW